jgi:hypothetical protein
VFCSFRLSKYSQVKAGFKFTQKLGVYDLIRLLDFLGVFTTVFVLACLN